MFYENGWQVIHLTTFKTFVSYSFIFTQKNPELFHFFRKIRSLSNRPQNKRKRREKIQCITSVYFDTHPDNHINPFILSIPILLCAWFFGQLFLFFFFTSFTFISKKKKYTLLYAICHWTWINFHYNIYKLCITNTKVKKHLLVNNCYSERWREFYLGFFLILQEME